MSLAVVVCYYSARSVIALVQVVENAIPTPEMPVDVNTSSPAYDASARLLCVKVATSLLAMTSCVLSRP